MSKITPTVANKISKDWLDLPMGMGPFRPMHLLKATGPFLVGIHLEPTRSKDAYTPTAHLHNLAVSFPVVSLSLPTPGTLLTLREHESGQWRRVGELLLSSVPTLRNEPVRVSDIESQHRNAVSSGRFPGFLPYLPVFESLFSFAVFLDEAAFADELRKYVSSQLRNAGATQGHRSVSAWEDWTTGLLANPSLTKRTVEAEAERHKVKAVPRAEFVRDKSLQSFW